jgi:hypothetical protein
MDMQELENILSQEMRDGNVFDERLFHAIKATKRFADALNDALISPPAWGIMS